MALWIEFMSCRKLSNKNSRKYIIISMIAKITKIILIENSYKKSIITSFWIILLILKLLVLRLRIFTDFIFFRHTFLCFSYFFCYLTFWSYYLVIIFLILLEKRLYSLFLYLLIFLLFYFLLDVLLDFI